MSTAPKLRSLSLSDTKTKKTVHGAWEYIDAVKMVGTLCNQTTGNQSIATNPSAPPAPAPPPVRPKRGAASLAPPPRVSGPPPPPGPPVGPLPPPRDAEWAPMELPELAAMILLASSVFVCACCWLGVVSHCRNAAVHRAAVSVQPASVPAPHEGAGSGPAVVLTHAAAQRSSRAPPGCEQMEVALHKPHQATRLGVQVHATGSNPRLAGRPASTLATHIRALAKHRHSSAPTPTEAWW